MPENFLSRLLSMDDKPALFRGSDRGYYFGKTGLSVSFVPEQGNCYVDFHPLGRSSPPKRLSEVALYAGMFRIGLGAFYESMNNGLRLPDHFILSEESKMVLQTNERLSNAVKRLFARHNHMELITVLREITPPNIPIYIVSIQLKNFLALPESDELISYLNGIRTRVVK